MATSPQHLSDQDLKQMRQRVQREDRYHDGSPTLGPSQAALDRAALLREVELLRAQLQQQESDQSSAKPDLPKASSEPAVQSPASLSPYQTLQTLAHQLDQLQYHIHAYASHQELAQLVGQAAALVQRGLQATSSQTQPASFDPSQLTLNPWSSGSMPTASQLAQLPQDPPDGFILS